VLEPAVLFVEKGALMISFGSFSGTGMHRWPWPGLIALTAIQVYYVREMVAALIIFSVLFCGVGVTALTLFLMDRASQLTLAWTGRKCGF
jgi:hypothetical protein